MAREGMKLKDALARHRARDPSVTAHKKSEKQSQVKQTLNTQQPRQKKQAGALKDVDVKSAKEDIAAEGGVAITANGEDDWEDEEDEDTDDEAEAGFDMSRLEDSDSESSDEDETTGGDDSMQQVKAALASLRANGIPTPKTSVVAQKVPKSALKSSAKPKSKANEPPEAKVIAEEEFAAEEDDEVNGDGEDADDAASDIPLSEVSDMGSATEDLVPHRRLTINNTAALSRSLASFALPLSSLPFSEHQTVTTTEPVSIPDIDDDLNRELALYAQCLSAAQEARRRLKAEKLPFTRPTDYFAEMVKSDEHMGKVKGRLVADAAGKQASADAKRQRELKKFGKQVQQEKLKERAQARKQLIEKVNVLKRKRQDGGLDSGGGGGGDDMFNVELENVVQGTGRDAKRRKDGPRSGDRGPPRAGAGAGGGNTKRGSKNEKFGFGGKKRFAKSGDAESSSDMRGFSVKKMKGRTGGGKGGAAMRPGKARRAKARG